MVILSAVFFFLAYHPMLSMPILTLVGVALGAALATLLRQRRWFFLIIPFFLFRESKDGGHVLTSNILALTLALRMAKAVTDGAAD
jgi:hypothetical protein